MRTPNYIPPAREPCQVWRMRCTCGLLGGRSHHKGLGWLAEELHLVQLQAAQQLHVLLRVHLMPRCGFAGKCCYQVGRLLLAFLELPCDQQDTIKQEAQGWTGATDMFQAGQNSSFWASL